MCSFDLFFPEPRLPKSSLAEDTDEMQEQTAKKREAEVNQEESPSRPVKKVAGGVKIPGLLEGLMGSKVSLSLYYYLQLLFEIEAHQFFHTL